LKHWQKVWNCTSGNFTFVIGGQNWHAEHEKSTDEEQAEMYLKCFKIQIDLKITSKSISETALNHIWLNLKVNIHTNFPAVVVELLNFSLMKRILSNLKFGFGHLTNGGKIADWGSIPMTLDLSCGFLVAKVQT